MSKLRHIAYTSLKWAGEFALHCIVAYLTRDRRSAHDRNWQDHPTVATGERLTFGQRAADKMRGALGTWAFLLTLAGAMLVWIITNGLGGHDPMPYILLNLCLSTLAGVQAAVLLIAAKRSDEVAAATALHTLDNTEQLRQLIEQNTELTRMIHDHILSESQPTPEKPQQPAQPPTRRKRAQRIPA